MINFIERALSANKGQVPSHYLRLAIWVVVCFGFAITSSTIVLIQKYQQHDTDVRFETVVNDNFANLNNALTEANPFLMSLAGYAAASDEVTLNIFEVLAAPALAHYPSIQALEWIPQVARRDKQVFEARARKQYDRYQILERDADGILTPAKVDRAFYYPVLFVVPLADNRNALGFDLGSNPKRSQALDHAISREAPTYSSRISLVQDRVKANGILLVNPVFSGDNRLKGFVLAVFRLSVLLKPVDIVAEKDGLLLTIRDLDAPQSEALLYQSPALAKPDFNGLGMVNPLSAQKAFEIGGRRWQVDYRAMPGYFEQSIAPLSWLAGLFGLLMTGALSFVLYRLYVSNRRYEIQISRLHEQFHQDSRYPGVWEWNSTNDHLSLSVDACRVLGVSDVSLIRGFQFYLSCIPVADRDLVQRQVVDALKAGTPFRIVHRILCPNGGFRHVESDCFIERDARGTPGIVVGIINDVTDRVQSQLRLQDSERTMSWVLSATGEGIWNWHLPTGVVLHNDLWYERLGYQKSELPNDVASFQKILHPEDMAMVMSRVQAALASGKDYSSEHRLVCKDGTVMWVIDRGRVVERDDAGQPLRMVGAYIDISDQKRNQETISRLAFYDSLTGLANRRLLENEVRKTLAKHARSGGYGLLIFVDLDDFKTLNDTQGHDVGDLLLQAFAGFLKSQVRDSDTVSRVGGDEFVILIDEAGETEAEAADAGARIASKILAGMAEPFDLNGYRYKTNASIGLAHFGDVSDTIVEVFKHADLAMYQAKQSGKGAYQFFDPESQRLLDRQTLIEAELAEAINQEQIIPLYQPIADQYGKIVGAETLCRWAHPERGLISPVDFVPYAEKSHLIVQIDELMLHHVCRQLAAWEDDPEYRHLVLSVNLSARFFGFSDFIARLIAVCYQYGTPMKQLKIELTESMLLKNIGEAARKVKELADYSIKLSLDDFGTGYSSLTYLQHLKINELKIDQSFVAHIFDDESSAAICKSILALAKSLELSVIAEGVETVAQRDFLVAHGCELLQGYLIGRPRGAADLLTNNVVVEHGLGNDE